MVPAMVLIILVNSVPKAPYVSMAHAISSVRLDGARDQLELEMVASNQRVVLAVLAASGDVGGVTRMAVLVNVGGRGRMGDDDVEEGGECLRTVELDS